MLSKTLLDPPGGVAVISDTLHFQVVVTNTGGTAWVTNPFTDTFGPCMSLLEVFQDGNPVPAVGPGSPLTWDFVPINGSPILPGQVVVIDLLFHADAGGVCVNRAEVLEIDRFGQRATIERVGAVRGDRARRPAARHDAPTEPVEGGGELGDPGFVVHGQQRGRHAGRP